MANGTCSKDGCENNGRIRRGLCASHYNRLRKAEKLAAGKICTQPECNGTVAARGWCKMHYMRWREHGDPNVVINMPRDGDCGYSQCTSPIKARGLCEKHYMRQYVHGDPSVNNRKIGRNQEICIAPNCTNINLARGWCSQHYSRWRETGDPLTSSSLIPRDKPCLAPGCPYEVASKGYCRSHYGKLQRHGDPLFEGRSARTKMRPYTKALIQRQAAERGFETIYDITIKDLRGLIGAPCIYCGDMSDTIDHVIPHKKGGVHGIGNLAPACWSCNSSKRDKLIIEWRYKAKRATRRPQRTL